MCIRDRPGDHLGYNRGYKVTDKMRIALLNIGYGHGYLVLPNLRQEVYFAGQLYPVVSQSMDFTTIDITGAECKPGDLVEIFGPNVSQDTDQYKIRIAGNIKREYVINQKVKYR